MLEWPSGGNPSLGTRFVGVAASVCQEPLGSSSKLDINSESSHLEELGVEVISV